MPLSSATHIMLLGGIVEAICKSVGLDNELWPADKQINKEQLCVFSKEI